MNANDLDNINWTIVNGQPQERIKLLSLISQILELTSNAMVNRRHGFSLRPVGHSANDDQRGSHRRTELSCETSGSNDSDGSSRRSEKPTGSDRNIAHLRAFTENSQRDRISQAGDGEFQDHQNDYTHSDDFEMVPEAPRTSGCGSTSGTKQTSSDKIKIGGNTHTSSRNNENSFNLNELLQSEVCVDIVDYYQENGHLDAATQKKLMQIICNELLKGPRASNETISRIASDVCMVFVTEDKREYYDHQPRKSPTGTFYNMYKNKLKKESSTINSRKRKAEAKDMETDNLHVFSDKIKESVDYLKAVHDDEDADTGMIGEHWSESFSYRRSTLRNRTYKNVAQAIDKWPIIKTNYGLDLIKFDFKRDYGPLCAKSLITNWKYIVRISEDVRKTISRHNTKIRLSIANIPSEDTNYDSVVLAKSLHYLVPPTAVGQKLTPSMEMSQKSFYQFARGFGELEQKIKSRLEHWRIKNIDPHPIIFGVKDNSSIQYVVVINELRIFVNDFLHAFDAAFKMFHFFNIAYPPESLKFWSIISVLFYEFNDGLHITGKLCTVIETLKGALKRLKHHQDPKVHRTNQNRRPDQGHNPDQGHRPDQDRCPHQDQNHGPDQSHGPDRNHGPGQNNHLCQIQ